MEWSWGNEHRITWALQAVDDEDLLDSLLDDLEAILTDPFAPVGVFVHRMRGTSDHVDRWVAHLAGGWVLTYTPYPGGVPPMKDPIVVVRDLRLAFALGDD